MSKLSQKKIQKIYKQMSKQIKINIKQLRTKFNYKKKAHKFRLDNNNSVTPSLPYLCFCNSGHLIVNSNSKRNEKASRNILLLHNINKQALQIVM